MMLFASSQPSPSLHSSPSRFLGSKLAVATPSVAPSSVSFFSVCNSARASTSRSSSYSSGKMAATPSSFYEVLGIPMGASCQEIKIAYRRLARACHPDVVAIERKEASADEFMKIHAAYATLLDPQKRVDYDRKLFRRQPRFSSSQYAATSTSSSTISRFRGYSRRTWETDQCW